MNTNALQSTFRKLEEAYKVKHGIPCERAFSDKVIWPSIASLEKAERSLRASFMATDSVVK